MAITGFFKYSDGPPIICGNGYTGDFGTVTDALTFASLGNNLAQQGDKIDFGDVGGLRDTLYVAALALDFATAPTLDNTFDVYMAWSNQLAATSANPGGILGSNQAYTGYNANLASSIKQLKFIGSLICTVDSTPRIQVQTDCGVFLPAMRYGTPVIYNRSGAALNANGVTQALMFAPLVSTSSD